MSNKMYDTGILLRNGQILGAAPGAAAPVDAVAVHRGRIIATGPPTEIRARLPAGHLDVDLAGRALTPGFVDAHLHPLPMCFYEHHVDLGAARTRDDVATLLAERAGEVGRGEWVVGLRLDPEALPGRDLPTCHDLDRATGSRPAVVLGRDGHHAVGSTAALDAAGIAPESPDPPGGVLHRDGAGRLTGLCGEAAAGILLSAVPVPAWDQLRQALDQVVARLLQHGVTGISAICQTGSTGPAGAAGALEAVAWDGLLDLVPLDVQTILIGASAAEVRDTRATRLHDPERRRRVDAVKLFLDGTLGGRTACMHEPFADGETSGMLTLDLDEAYRQMVDAHTAGLQICIHAIGDRATRTAALLYQRLQREHPGGDPRHRVEHASVLDPSTVDLLGGLGVSAVVQPAFIASERAWLARRLGPDRLDRAYPFRSLLDAGVRLAGSSDAPIEPVSVTHALHCATDRRDVGPAQAITGDEALALYTSGAAWARRTERDTGTIAPGRRADLAVLSADPRTHPREARVLATVVGGEVAWDGGGVVASLGAPGPEGAG